MIDGSKLLLTPFDKAHVPPPMSFAQYTSSGQILDIAFNGDKIALLTCSQVEFLAFVNGALAVVGRIKYNSANLD